MRTDITHPALRALLMNADEQGFVAVSWADGDTAIVRFDTFIPSDETHDGSEEWIVNVMKVIAKRSKRNRGLVENESTVISSLDPPTRISRLDGQQAWP
jgi:hypothetical protein